MISYSCQIDPDRVVARIVTKNGCIDLPIPTKAKDLCCPNCGSVDGFLNSPWDAWSCLEEKCLSLHVNAKSPKSLQLKKDEIFPEEVPYTPSRRDDGVPIIYQSARLHDCHLPKDQKEVLAQMASDPKGVLVLFGPSGVGKTWSACATLNDSWEKKETSIMFVNVSDLYLRWKECTRKQESDLILASMYRNADLLLVDDIGTRSPTDSFLDFLYAIVNFRINHSKATIFTTNMNGSQMRDKFGEALTSRICSGSILKIEGRDKRIK